MSNLEKFINDNRDEFDDQVPPAKVWKHIEADIAKKTSVRFLSAAVYRWSLGTAAMLVIALGVYFFTHKPKEELATKQDTKTDSVVSAIAPDESPQIYQYVKMIDARQEELKALSKEQPELYHKFINDITQLDSSYDLLKTRLSVTPNKEMLMEAMIQNLELQLSVLNEQLNIIKEIKKSKKLNHEKKFEAI